MADLFDLAQETEAHNRDQNLKVQKARSDSEPKLEHTGECRNPVCCEPVEYPRLFCDAKCAAQHAKYLK